MYAPSELVDQTEYALGVATTVLDFYESYYGIRYPLNKSGETTSFSALQRKRLGCSKLIFFQEQNFSMYRCLIPNFANRIRFDRVILRNGVQ